MPTFLYINLCIHFPYISNKHDTNRSMWTCENILGHISEIYISTYLWVRVHWRTDLRNITSDMSFSLDILSMENKIK